MNSNFVMLTKENKCALEGFWFVLEPEGVRVVHDCQLITHPILNALKYELKSASRVMK